ncbi:MAG: NADPH dehydrogenase [Tissierellia bacterium]|nr:NADPH dehydrogenase [Tissierellia bacterium]
MKLFEEYKDDKFTLKNHLVMPPMCMYQCLDKDGLATDFHPAHYGARAIGQVATIIVESTGVQANGRITDFCLGIWNDDQLEGHKRIVRSIKGNGSFAAIQLNHAGRKSETQGIVHWGPSRLAFNDKEIDYEEMTLEEIDQVVNNFRKAAKRADEAGYDAIEIHAAHGYLIHQFLSPLSNQRKDKYGKDRFLFLKEIISAIKEVWPEEKALWMRISATDYHEDGLKLEDWINFLKFNDKLVDFIHVSAGGLINVAIDVYPGYMLDLSRKIREETGYKTIGVGLIKDLELASYALESGACDLLAIGRQLLRNPNLYLDFLSRKAKGPIPSYYERAFK